MNVTTCEERSDGMMTSATSAPEHSSIPFSLPLQPFFVAELPIPPGINKSYRVVVVHGHGRIGHTLAAQHYLENAPLLLSQAATHDALLVHAIRKSRFKIPLAVDLRFFFPTLWKRDVDGGVKIVLDAIFGYLQLNDNLVTGMHVTKEVDAERPRVEIEVRCLLNHPNK